MLKRTVSPSRCVLHERKRGGRRNIGNVVFFLSFFFHRREGEKGKSRGRNYGLLERNRVSPVRGKEGKNEKNDEKKEEMARYSRANTHWQFLVFAFPLAPRPIHVILVVIENKVFVSRIDKATTMYVRLQLRRGKFF